MAKPGRKRKNGVARTPSGQISRAGKDPRTVVLQQRHRAGSLSQARSSAAGRFLSDDASLTAGASRTTLLDAANRFAQAYGNWQAAVASRRPMAVTSGGSNAPEDVEKTQRAIERYERANTVLQRAGHAIRQATHDLCTGHFEEDWKPPFNMAYHAVEGLKLLAEHFGLDWMGEDRKAA